MDKNISKIIISSLMLVGIVQAKGEETQQLSEENQRTKYVLEYANPQLFLNDFKNIELKADQPLKYWAAQLILFFQSNPELRPFCFELAKVVRYKSPLIIGGVFLKHQHRFAHELQESVIKDFAKIWGALEHRSKL